MSKIEVQELVKRYDRNLVVNQVNFSVEDGEFFVLLGPSGGGKTTILRLICGLETPDSGQIVLGGTDITRFPPRQRNLGMVFQDYGLYPSMDVFGNIAYGLENRHVPRPEIQKRVAEAAEKLKLTPLLRREITMLSGGEQQRVALARILARDADLFLYDEPLANLDPKLRYQARRDILAVHQLRGVPSIYVTHDQGEAFAIGHRIGVMAHGKLQQVGTPAELLEEPANLFMARFIGNPPMNLLPATLGGEGALQAGGLDWPLTEPLRAAAELAESNELVLGIRPQNVVAPWLLEHSEEDLLQLKAEVASVEAFIGEVVVYLKLLAGDQLTGTELAAVWAEPDTLPEVGETLMIGLSPAQFCLFDGQSERALSVKKR